MTLRDKSSADETTGEHEHPEPPTYECPYEPGDAGYDMAQSDGYHGIAHSEDYEWTNVKLTREAYGDTTVGRPTGWSTTIDGQPRRSLKFHTRWMSLEEAMECVDEIPPYNRFDPDDFRDVLAVMPDHVKVVVGRESSVVLYFWTVEAPTVMTILKGYTPDGGLLFDGPALTVPPDELGAVPGADTYPLLRVGTPADELADGVGTLVRAWFD